MTTNQNTKKALRGSLTALFLCIVMLIGTTFAWFTDSVSSGTNRIQSGNLKIDLLMDKSEDGNYKSIAGGEGDIFSEETGNGILWEPGKTEIVYLAVQNKGSLALNYNIILNVEDDGMAGSLEYALLDGKKAADLKNMGSWSDLKNVEGVQTGDIAAGKTIAAPNGTLDEIALSKEKNETDYFALAVHMDENAGNEYMNGSVIIDVNVIAKQAVAETDSFGNDYDAGATYPAANAAEFKDAVTNAEDGDTVALTGNIKLEASLTIKKDITIDGMGNAIISEKPVHVNSDNNVTFKDVQFTAPKNDNNNATSVYASKLKETVVFDGCTFKDFQWEAIQITPVEGSEVVINNCYFENSKTMAESGIETKRYVHIEGDDFNTKNVKVTLTNNTFKNVVQSAKGGNGYFSDSAVTICFIDDLSENLICSGNVFTGVVAENALTNPYIIWITTSGDWNAPADYFDGFEIK